MTPSILSLKPSRFLLVLALGCSADPPEIDVLPPADSLHYPVPPPSDASGDRDAATNPWLEGIPGQGDESPSTGGTIGLETGGSGGFVPGAPSASGGAEGGAPRRLPRIVLVGYEETTGAHKYLTLENRGLGTSLPEECGVLVFSNGSSSQGRRIAIPSLAAGERILLCTSDAPVERCGSSMGSAPFNGDDALVVRCGESDTDVFGRVGEDPGDAWKGGGLSTKDAALVRCGRKDRLRDGSFVLEAEWGPWPSGVSLDEALAACPSEERGLGGTSG